MQNPKHILITGASSGIGAALAKLYAAPNVHLSLHGRDEKRLEEVAALASQQGASVTIKSLDIANGEALIEWIRDCDEQQPIDLIIANAGISTGTGRNFEKPEQTKVVFDVNVQGVFNTINPILPHMIKRGRGQVAIMSSLASFRGFAGSATYCASKAAVRVYGEALHSECANRGIEVNVICPGFIKTPMTDVNHFHMPFLISAEHAAKIIRCGLARNKARIAFPLPMYLAIRLFTALPQSWIDGLSRILPKKR